MPRASKFRFKEKDFKEIHEHFLYLISSLNDSNKAARFFNEFLTNEERIMLVKRLALYMMLKKNYSPSSIQDLLHVSYETVRSHKIKLLKTTKEFNDLINKLLAREKTKVFFRKIESALTPLSHALRSKSDMKARAKFASGENSNH